MNFVQLFLRYILKRGNYRIEIKETCIIKLTKNGPTNPSSFITLFFIRSMFVIPTISYRILSYLIYHLGQQEE